MVSFYISQTCVVNPPDTSPLKLSDLWEVLVEKCRKPQLFVAPILDCKVLEETPTSMEREVTFAPGVDPHGNTALESLELRAPFKVDFYTKATGTFVNNTVSQGKDLNDLYLTFYFEWGFPDIEEDSEQYKQKEQELWGLAKKTVQHTIDIAREMKRDGKIKGAYEGKF